MRIIPETPALARKVEAAGILARFTHWASYRRQYLAFRAGEQIVTAGDTVDGFYLLLAGRIRVYTLNPEGKLLTLIVCRAGEPTLLGDVEYLTGQTSPNHVEAVEDAVLLKVFYDRERMERDIALYHFLVRMLLLKMEMSSVESSRRMLYALPQRFAGYLLDMADGDRFTGSYTEAAGYLGCSYRQLMRIVSSFYRDGLLCREGKSTRILDPARLRQMAEGK